MLESSEQIAKSGSTAKQLFTSIQLCSDTKKDNPSIIDLFPPTRFRKNFAQLLEDDAVNHPEPPNYLSAQVAASTKPPRALCSVCGFPSAYNCVVCGTRFCSTRCQETHQETRCLKWTA